MISIISRSFASVAGKMKAESAASSRFRGLGGAALGCFCFAALGCPDSVRALRFKAVEVILPPGGAVHHQQHQQQSRTPERQQKDLQLLREKVEGVMECLECPIAGTVLQFPVRVHGFLYSKKNLQEVEKRGKPCPMSRKVLPPSVQWKEDSKVQGLIENLLNASFIKKEKDSINNEYLDWKYDAAKLDPEQLAAFAALTQNVTFDKDFNKPLKEAIQSLQSIQVEESQQKKYNEEESKFILKTSEKVYILNLLSGKVRSARPGKSNMHDQLEDLLGELDIQTMVQLALNSSAKKELLLASGSIRGDDAGFTELKAVLERLSTDEFVRWVKSLQAAYEIKTLENLWYKLDVRGASLVDAGSIIAEEFNILAPTLLKNRNLNTLDEWVTQELDKFYKDLEETPTGIVIEHGMLRRYLEIKLRAMGVNFSLGYDANGIKRTSFHIDYQSAIKRFVDLDSKLLRSD